MNEEALEDDDIDRHRIVGDRLPPRSDGFRDARATGHRARRRRFAHAVGWSWAWTTGCAFLFAWPAAAVVARAVGSHPRGDAILWDPGALDLLEFLGETEASRAPLRVLGLVVLLVFSVLGLIPLGAELSALAFTTAEGRAASHRRTLARALDAFPAFASLGVIAFVVELSTFGAGLFVAAGTRDALRGRASDPIADLAGAGVLVLFAALVALAFVLHDLARAAAIRDRLRTARALRAALEGFLRAPWGLCGAWAGCALLGLLPVALLALAGPWGRGGAAPVAVLFLAHQGALLGRASARAWWLARALR